MGGGEGLCREHPAPRGALSAAAVALVLAALIFAHGIVNYRIARADRLPLFKDLAHNSHMGLIWNVRLSPWVPDRPADTITSYPPLFFLSTPFFYHIFGEGSVGAAMTNILYLALLLLATYKIGRHLYSRNAGILAALLLSLFPQIYGQARVPMLDLSLTAMVAVSVWLLLETDHFRRTGWTLLLGLSMGLGMLAKWTYPIYVAGPCAWYLWQSWRAGPTVVRRLRLLPRWLNVLLAILLGLGLAALWYVPNMSGVKAHLFDASQHVNIDVVGRWSPGNILFYFHHLYLAQVLDFFFILFLASAAWCFYRRDKWRWLFVAWLIIPYLFFTLVIVVNKTPRYYLPVLPAVSLFVTAAIVSLRAGWARRLTAASAAGVVLLQFCVFTYSPLHGRLFQRLGSEKSYMLNMEPGSRYGRAFNNRLEVGLLSPESSDWGVEGLIRDLIRKKRQRVGENGQGRLLILSDLFVLSSHTFRYYLSIHGEDRLKILSFDPAEYPEIREVRDICSLTDEIDFLVLSFCSPDCTARSFYELLWACFEERFDRFRLVRDFTLPDKEGHKVMLYERLPHGG